MTDEITLKELAFPLIKAIDSFNFLLKNHHRRVAVISFYIGRYMQLEENRLADMVTAAALHDIGALSVQERDMLVQKDVLDPLPHCIMGSRMLASCDFLSNIANIIRYHHIYYGDRERYPDALLESYIIHLADRVDIHVDPNRFILNQKKQITDDILEKCGSAFHPDVCKAFSEVGKADIFWIELNNMTLDQLFKKIQYNYNYTLSTDQIMQFGMVVSRIIDFRSAFTASHSYNVAHLAAFLGRLCGLDEESCTKLKLAGLFHDIGKIGIDTKYIDKKGPLNEDEFNHVKLHTYYTYQILDELSFSSWFEEIVQWASNHHEKTDGTGYPYRKSGEELDIGTRIISYADMISALMESRPYRTSLPIDTVIEVIKNEVSTVLYPEILEHIEANKAEIVEIINRCANEMAGIYSKNIDENFVE